MDPMQRTPAEALRLLPTLLTDLSQAEQLSIRNLTGRKVVEALPAEAGLYLFSRSKDDGPVYVGRSANLPQRVGTNHRSTQENQAPVTKALKTKFNFATMKEARDMLFEDYVVRLLAEPDAPTRALLEIYAAMALNTEFNSFLEH